MLTLSVTQYKSNKSSAGINTLLRSWKKLAIPSGYVLLKYPYYYTRRLLDLWSPVEPLSCDLLEKQRLWRSWCMCKGWHVWAVHMAAMETLLCPLPLNLYMEQVAMTTFRLGLLGAFWKQLRIDSLCWMLVCITYQILICMTKTKDLVDGSENNSVYLGWAYFSQNLI